MFAKIFAQIFDSSIAENPSVRRMFMDMLVLADNTGAIDMTHEAISRRTNVPLEEVKQCIAALEEPDGRSRSKNHQGKRLIPLEEGRGWGWKVVNWQKYRESATKEMLRMADAERKAEYRRRHGNPSPYVPPRGTDTEEDAEADPSRTCPGHVRDMSGTQPELITEDIGNVKLRMGKLFRRRPDTRWTDSELKALRKILPIPEDEFQLIERYYAASIPLKTDYRRRDLGTLLNNWSGEVDRARGFKPAPMF